MKSKHLKSLSHLADDGELRPVDVVAVDPQREHGGQSHHAAHGRHVVQVRLRVLDVADSHKRTEKKKHQGGENTGSYDSCFDLNLQVIKASLRRRALPPALRTRADCYILSCCF